MTEEYFVHVQARLLYLICLGGSNASRYPSLHRQDAQDPLASRRMISFVQKYLKALSDHDLVAQTSFSMLSGANQIVVGNKSAGFLLVKLFSALLHHCF